jgi:hypothetical protein
VCGWVFTHVFGFAGADQSFPLFAFVFLVALGIDYNIFLMTRVREESVHFGTRPGILRGLAVTGGVITSAGVVLAATFTVLGVLPLVFLAELGFAVAFGVLLDTLIVQAVMVPALAHDIGPTIPVAVQAGHHRPAGPENPCGHRATRPPADAMTADNTMHPHARQRPTPPTSPHGSHGQPPQSPVATNGHRFVRPIQDVARG